MKIHWREASTRRGLIWIITAIAGVVLLHQGKPVDQLLLLASAVAGGLGVVLED